jgi:hypothetical protein
LERFGIELASGTRFGACTREERHLREAQEPGTVALREDLSASEYRAQFFVVVTGFMIVVLRVA